MKKKLAESVFVYVVARDFGFAPNPFHGFCTLACCKPRIRAVAQTGDWVIGVAGSALAEPGRCIFGMRVTEIMTFDEYWLDSRFEVKKPLRNGSRVMMLGDNIYHRDNDNAGWQQEDSHHSHPDGSPDASNIKTDTQANRVLISDQFNYFGASAPLIPSNVLSSIGYSNGRNHRRFSMQAAEPLLSWFQKEAHRAGSIIVNDPFQFRLSSARFSSGSNKIIDEVVEPFMP
ncbi:hypothetical protein KUG85_18315 [Nitratireductor sp. L1-7-SE]|uniref:Nucleotide modification associated domain-containing protein n=1 Tax=Nitratireductor rhodophyticola TaxID=2854036 RepID=A0ABS7RE75_9HYPH|nr:hypothetical protein [Nitratireductor rhodophyticola]MBY8917963.1 hypothetical protein [Nitratireductor rhodophyticola]MBY8922674.1 hypothetical protein [Nitratireductor rhodophyticola]